MSFGFSSTVAQTSGSLKYFDNYNTGVLEFGPEESISDYVELTNDPISNLPEDFTVCSSLYIKYMTAENNFIEFFQANGSHWFQLDIEQLRDLDYFTERMTMHFGGKEHKFWKSGVPIKPHTWYHLCLGLNTMSGHLRIVLNGYTVVNEVYSFFKDSQNIRPQSLIGKILVFKTQHLGYWYQTRNIFSNMNIFSSLLTKDSMVDITSGKDCAVKGSYLSWEDMEWKVAGSVTEGSVTLEDLCQQENQSSVILPTTFRSWQQCMEFCPKLRQAKVIALHSKAEAVALTKWLFKITQDQLTLDYYPGVPGGAFWIPFHDTENEGTWVQYDTNAPANAVEAQSDDLNGGRAENCGLFVAAWNGWNDWSCEIEKSQPIMCACHQSQEMYLLLRGLCADSNIDQFYVPRNKKRHGSFMLIGVKNTVIEFLTLESVWKLSVFGTTQNTSATTGSSMDSYLLGSHMWKIEEDYKKCSNRGEPYVRRLKLSGCRDGEFTCTDGQCIRMVERCDQIIQCRDESDEMECSILLIKDSYNKKVPPFTIDRKNKLILPVKVYISTNLKNVIEISEVNHLIELKFGITLVWYENRVSYHNLKRKEALNTFSDTELEALWIPYIIFDNTDNEDAVTIYDTRSMVSVKREGSFIRSAPEITD